LDEKVITQQQQSKQQTYNSWSEPRKHPGTSRTAVWCVTYRPPRKLNILIEVKLFDCCSVLGGSIHKNAKFAGHTSSTNTSFCYIFGLRPQTQPIYSFGIGVPIWPLFRWWFPISIYYSYALYWKCWEPPILTSGKLTSGLCGFPGKHYFPYFVGHSLGLWLGINLLNLI